MDKANLNMEHLINYDCHESNNEKKIKENIYQLPPGSVEEIQLKPSISVSSVKECNTFVTFETAQTTSPLSTDSMAHVTSKNFPLTNECHLSNEMSLIKKCVSSEGTLQMSYSCIQENLFTTTDGESSTSVQIKRKIPVHVPSFRWKPDYPIPGVSSPFPMMQNVTPRISRKQNHVDGIKMPIAGIMVEFPYEAYPVQKYMMSQVLSAVKTARHCLLESPTGTGKTLSLLCSTLAWQQREEELLRELKINAAEPISAISNEEKKKAQPVTEVMKNSSTGKPKTSTITVVELSSDSDNEDIFQTQKYKKKKIDCEETPIKLESSNTGVNKLDDSFNVKMCIVEEKTEGKCCEMASGDDPVRLPKIFYGTRTHKQIAQVVEQLKKTTYANKVKMTILAARDHSCVNNQVRQSGNITEQCQALIDPVMGNGCSYFTGSNRGVSHQILQSCGLPTVYDIEDIVNVGKRHKVCPYFTLRNLVVQSDIIFCPYNYLIDPIIRESMNINLAKSIVIMDEAHNIEDTCRAAGSLWLRQMELEEAIFECKENINRGNNKNEYAKIQEFLIAMDNWLTNNGPSIQYSAESESVKSISGKDIVNWFDIEGITYDKFQELKENVNLIKQKRIEIPDENQAISGKVRLITSSIITVLDYLFKPTNVNKYQAYFFKEIRQKKPLPSSTSGSWLSKHTNKTIERVWQFSLHLMCLSPEVVFSELLNARSIILASGTLSPLETFQSELGVDFPYIVKGWHVVPRKNIFVSAVANGPHKLDLKGVYENANKYEYQDELGKSILETIKIVPHGVLCFFPSYYLMDKLKDRWISTGLLEELGQVKEMFWEPRGKQDMNRIMNDFTEQIDLSVENPEEEIGAILFGVFRGKIAEGIDFSDNMARAVISVGIPFMNMNSKEINLKIKYNNENPNKNVLPGYQWYRIQAYRALNQALGRCIRHSKDWGAVILMDSRLCLEDAQKNLPKWIQQQLMPFQNWENYVRNLSAFCHQMEEIQESTSNVAETSCENPPSV